MNLKDMREEAIMTQGLLADAAKVSKVSLSRWENGVRMPGPTFIHRLAKALGKTPQEVLHAAQESRRQYREQEAKEHVSDNAPMIAVAS